MENLGCHTVRLYHLPSVVPRQPSCLDLQVKLPAIANAAQPPDQADPPISHHRIAAELSGQAVLGLGGRYWEAPHKKAGLSATYPMIWEPCV